ncbi:hypothetical protein G4X40_19760 [Rhodococcus sp. D2-41]|uniref:Uncharacterized protein n=1 Tax=Speluncibacter jeojiensis TaxID=2710754 RepID=A0A9X4RCY7_9ACTN|nr:hypothetical protein [Rhodococcus sp. D2-41]MDG3012380.1 hypothetical protein [Rhodococcus sp. D2-41]MDG3013552.1 hypothetical protein [Corynebacteriales bacterium D3-21]
MATFYCDDYERITGKLRADEDAETMSVSTKVVSSEGKHSAPEPTEGVETK